VKSAKATGSDGYSNAYDYDDNGNMTSRTLDGHVFTLTDDGDGNRAKGTVDGVTTVYIGDYYEESGGTVRQTQCVAALRP